MSRTGVEVPRYQIRTAPSSTTMPQAVLLASSVGLNQGKIDDPTLKREMRLAKNREAARECRRKKKEYIKSLENRVTVLMNQNRTLLEELETLKSLSCNKQDSPPEDRWTLEARWLNSALWP